MKPGRFYTPRNAGRRPPTTVLCLYCEAQASTDWPRHAAGRAFVQMGWSVRRNLWRCPAHSTDRYQRKDPTP